MVTEGKALPSISYVTAKLAEKAGATRILKAAPLPQAELSDRTESGAELQNTLY